MRGLLGENFLLQQMNLDHHQGIVQTENTKGLDGVPGKVSWI